jgi:O-antigen/teichoic acid export membrane protein
LIVAGRARSAFINDSVWGVIQIPLMLAAAHWWQTPAALLLAWGVAGCLCAALGLAQGRILPVGPRAIRGWFAEHRTLWPWFTLDNTIYQASNFGLVLVLSFLASLTEVGALRVAMTAFAPLTVLSRGLVGVLVPELARGRSDAARVRRRSVFAGSVLVLLAAAWWAGLQVLPLGAGQALFGESWTLARPLIGWLTISIAAGLFMSGLVVALRALGAAREGMAARLIATFLVVGASTVGAQTDGARGVVIALAALAPVQIAIWWVQLSRTVARATRDRQNEVPAEPGLDRPSAG